jgi:hypothetical protein
MARPRKSSPASDPLAELAKKTEILEREMNAQRTAMERLKQMSARPRPLRAGEASPDARTKRRMAR